MMGNRAAVIPPLIVLLSVVWEVGFINGELSSSSEMRLSMFLDSKLCAISRPYCNARATAKNKVLNSLRRAAYAFVVESEQVGNTPVVGSRRPVSGTYFSTECMLSEGGNPQHAGSGASLL